MARARTPKSIPRFRSEAEERAFWEAHDVTEYADFSEAREASFPNLKLSTETISLRLPAGLLAELKTLANQRDVPYQSLLKVFLAERVAKERGTRRRTPGRRVQARASGTRRR
jgi:predicted DNA binding CopG/RHH family protein